MIDSSYEVFYSQNVNHKWNYTIFEGEQVGYSTKDSVKLDSIGDAKLHCMVNHGDFKNTAIDFFKGDWDMSNKEDVLEAVSYSGQYLEKASKELRSDAEVVKAAISNDGNSIRYADEKFLNNKEFAVIALSDSSSLFMHERDTLRYFTSDIKNDIDIVMTSISNELSHLYNVRKEIDIHFDKSFVDFSNQIFENKLWEIKSLKYASDEVKEILGSHPYDNIEKHYDRLNEVKSVSPTSFDREVQENMSQTFTHDKDGWSYKVDLLEFFNDVPSTRHMDLVNGMRAEISTLEDTRDVGKYFKTIDEAKADCLGKFKHPEHTHVQDNVLTATPKKQTARDELADAVGETGLGGNKKKQVAGLSK